MLKEFASTINNTPNVVVIRKYRVIAVHTKQPAKYLIKIRERNEIPRAMKATAMKIFQVNFKSFAHSLTFPISTNLFIALESALSIG